MYCKALTGASTGTVALAANTGPLSNPLGPIIATITILLLTMMIFRYRIRITRRNK